MSANYRWTIRVADKIRDIEQVVIMSKHCVACGCLYLCGFELSVWPGCRFSGRSQSKADCPWHWEKARFESDALSNTCAVLRAAVGIKSCSGLFSLYLAPL